MKNKTDAAIGPTEEKIKVAAQKVRVDAQKTIDKLNDVGAFSHIPFRTAKSQSGLNKWIHQTKGLIYQLIVDTQFLQKVIH